MRCAHSAPIHRCRYNPASPPHHDPLPRREAATQQAACLITKLCQRRRATPLLPRRDQRRVRRRCAQVRSRIGARLPLPIRLSVPRVIPRGCALTRGGRLITSIRLVAAITAPEAGRAAGRAVSTGRRGEEARRYWRGIVALRARSRGMRSNICRRLGVACRHCVLARCRLHRRGPPHLRDANRCAIHATAQACAARRPVRRALEATRPIRHCLVVAVAHHFIGVHGLRGMDDIRSRYQNAHLIRHNLHAPRINPAHQLPRRTRLDIRNGRRQRIQHIRGAFQRRRAAQRVVAETLPCPLELLAARPNPGVRSVDKILCPISEHTVNTPQLLGGGIKPLGRRRQVIRIGWWVVAHARTHSFSMSHAPASGQPGQVWRGGGIRILASQQTFPFPTPHHITTPPHWLNRYLGWCGCAVFCFSACAKATAASPRVSEIVSIARARSAISPRQRSQRASKLPPSRPGHPAERLDAVALRLPSSPSTSREALPNSTAASASRSGVTPNSPFAIPAPSCSYQAPPIQYRVPARRAHPSIATATARVKHILSWPSLTVRALHSLPETPARPSPYAPW